MKDFIKSIFSIRKILWLSVFTLSFALIMGIIISIILNALSANAMISNNDYDVIVRLLSGAIAATSVAIVLFGLQPKFENEKRDTNLHEANFLLELNKSFIQDPQMYSVEESLEVWNESRQLSVDPDSRQSQTNYLVYLEALNPLVERKIVTIEHIDDLMAYRFFLGINNRDMQTFHIIPFPDYYRGCFKLYKKWDKYRKEQGYPIQGRRYAINKWEHFEYYARNDNYKFKASEKIKEKEFNRFTVSLFEHDELKIEANIIENAISDNETEVKIEFDGGTYYQSDLMVSHIMQMYNKVIFCDDEKLKDMTKFILSDNTYKHIMQIDLNQTEKILDKHEFIESEDNEEAAYRMITWTEYLPEYLMN